MNFSEYLQVLTSQVVFWILGLVLTVLGGYLLLSFLDEVCYDARPSLSQQYGSKAVYIFLGIVGALLVIGLFFLHISSLLRFLV